MERSKEVKIIIAVLFIIVLLGFYARYKPYDYVIQHDYPVAIGSADANSRVSEIEGFIISHQSYYEPSWFNDDKTKTGIIKPEPLLSLTAAALLSQMSGLPAFDSIYLITVLVAIGIAITFFLIFWKLLNNLWLGLISAILLVYPFEWFYNFDVLIGMYPHFTQAIFLLLSVLFFLKYVEDKKKSSVIGSAIMLGFAFLTHSPNSIFLSVFFGLIFLFMLVKKEINYKDIIIFFGIWLLISAIYIPLLLGQYFGVGQGESQSGVGKIINTNMLFQNSIPGHQIQLSNFLQIPELIFLLVGLASAFAFFKNRNYKLIVLFFIFFFTIIILSSYFGVNQDHLNNKPRYIFYIFAYPIVAIGIYFTSTIVKKLTGAKQLAVLSIVVLLLIVLQITNLQKVNENQSSILTKDSYDTYVWAKNNIPEGKKILCIGCVQFEGLYTHHPTYLPSYELEQETVNQMIRIIQDNSSDKMVRIHNMGHSGNRPYWNGFHLAFYGPKFDGNQSICSFDYYIIKDRNNQLMGAMGQKLINKNNSLIHITDTMAVIQNKNVLGDCI